MGETQIHLGLSRVHSGESSFFLARPPEVWRGPLYPFGAVTAIGVGAAIMVLGYFGSMAIFSRRDLTRLP